MIQLEKVNGMPSRNGVVLNLSVGSDYSPGVDALMQIDYADGWHLFGGGIAFTEIRAVECVTNADDFSAPNNAEYFMSSLPDGRTAVLVFVLEMQSHLLHWIFPAVEGRVTKVYQDLVAEL